VQQTYDGALKVMLPDTFGTTQFLAGAPDWVADWTGSAWIARILRRRDEFIAWLKGHGTDPLEKLVIASTPSMSTRFSDCMPIWRKPCKWTGAERFLGAADFTIVINGRRAAGSFQRRLGTLLTNDFRGCNPNDGGGFDPISLICKVSSVEGRPAVKLSDNYSKALGPHQKSSATGESLERRDHLQCSPRSLTSAN